MTIRRQLFKAANVIRPSTEKHLVGIPSEVPPRAAPSRKTSLVRQPRRWEVRIVNAISDDVGPFRKQEGHSSRYPALVIKKIDAASLERSQKRAALMVRVQEGDPEACRVLLDDIGPMLANFLRRRIADRDEAEDLYQETLMAFFEARHTYQPSRPLEPWLFAIARNVAADHARHYWARVSVEHLIDKVPEQSADDEPRSGPRLEEALARLPDQQRQAFSMVKLEGMSIEQAANRAGISVGALRVRAHRAYKALKKLIADYE